MNPETIALGVQTTIVGLGVVFIMLAILWGVVALLDKIVESWGQKQPPNGGAGGGDRQPAPAPAAAPAPTVTAENRALNVDTVAAIMGAICAFSGKPLAMLKFTAIRRDSGPRLAWSEAGVAELINTRQQYL
jgi:Na+-transporting methylmalonyl-CoA/oxaloacetate decarboxylase gamma subunit